MRIRIFQIPDPPFREQIGALDKKEISTRSSGNMRSSHLNVMLLSTGLAAMSAGLGCGVDSSGGGGQIPRCNWTENDAGLTFPVCPGPYTSEFMGTVDGMPFDSKDSGNVTATSPPVAPPYQLSMRLADSGSLDIWWDDPYIWGQWSSITGGDMRVPGDWPKIRGVFQNSRILRSCDEYSFLYILHIEGGDLTGCSR